MRLRLHELRLPRLLGSVAAIALLLPAASSQAETGASGSAKSSGKTSLLDMAPALFHQMIRYPKFYGDPDLDRATIDGSPFERQYLLGSLGGTRDTLAEHGVVIDASVTQVVQGSVSEDGDGGRYFGSGDLWFAIDSGRADLWPGGLLYGHLEGDWGRLVKGTGALVPLNGDNIMPAAPSEVALSELYLVQGLPMGFAVIGGKADWAAFADTSPFANNERTQFLYEGLINNPILGSFVPYTSLGVLITKQVTDDFLAALIATSNNTNATSAGFDELSADTMTYGAALAWTPELFGLPGDYNLLIGYTTKNSIDFAIDERYLIGEITGQVPVAKKGDNRALTLGASQYLWVDRDARRSDGLPVGIGPFFRFGISPTDRNLFDRFYSAGIGGNGGPLGRSDDSWGIGWAGTHFSSDFRRDAELLGARLGHFEQVVEAFYNVALTPAMKLSFHAQSVDSVARGFDAFVLASRLQLDF